MFDIEVVTCKASTDCGAACLKMLLAYYGIEEDIKVLSEKLNVGVGGCTAGALKRVGKEYGLNVIAYGSKSEGGIDAEELITQDRPAILWWKFCHYVIFDGLDDDGVPVIINPSSGRMSIPFGSFKAFFSSVSIWNGDPGPIE